MAVDTSREAVERDLDLLLADAEAGEAARYAPYTVSLTQRVKRRTLALLARAEAAERREAACTLLTGTPGALTVNCIRGAVRCTERERIEAQRDAAIAERDRLAEAAENVMIARGMGWDMDGVLDALEASINKEPTDGE